MDDYCDWRSLREIDETAGSVKGSAFRVFKAGLADLVEGRDFIVLDHQMHAALASQLHAQGRLYPTSVHPVLLAPAAASTIARRLETASTGP